MKHPAPHSRRTHRSESACSVRRSAEWLARFTVRADGIIVQQKYCLCPIGARSFLHLPEPSRLDPPTPQSVAALGPSRSIQIGSDVNLRSLPLPKCRWLPRPRPRARLPYMSRRSARAEEYPPTTHSTPRRGRRMPTRTSLLFNGIDRQYSFESDSHHVTNKARKRGAQIRPLSVLPPGGSWLKHVTACT